MGTLRAQKQWIGRSEGVQIMFEILLGNEKDFIKVFTTRADTLMGVTYITLAPEHPLVDKLLSLKSNPEMEKYINMTSCKSDLERTASNEKTGVFTGFYANHPISK